MVRTAEEKIRGFSKRELGEVVEARSGEPLPAANVILEGTNQGASADFSGEYEITGIEEGTYTLKVYVRMLDGRKCTDW